MNALLWLLVLLAGCTGAHRDHGDDMPDAGGGGVTCGNVTCEPPAPTCTGTTLHTSSSTCEAGACSYPTTDVECGPAGCCGDHCCEVAASNSDVFGTLETTGLVVSPPNGTFNTDTDCTDVSALGTCAIATRPDLGEACVCRMDELTIGTLKVEGSRALVLLAARSVVVQTWINVSGDGAVDGPGASSSYPEPTNSLKGGAGGSFGTSGAGSTSVVAAVYGNDTLIPLHGGMRGQTGGRTNGGGGGGGALQITAGVRIEIAGTINAGGGGGLGGVSIYGYSGGSGGGSGGAVLLEAPTVVVTGTIVSNGAGGGGGGGDSSYGSVGYDGGTDRASGGDGSDGTGCPLYGYVSGGTGGAGAFGAQAATRGGASDYDSRCFGTASFVGEGGAGGGNGRIRINTMTGCQCNGTVVPSASFGTLRAE